METGILITHNHKYASKCNVLTQQKKKNHTPFQLCRRSQPNALHSSVLHRLSHTKVVKHVFRYRQQTDVSHCSIRNERMGQRKLTSAKQSVKCDGSVILKIVAACKPTDGSKARENGRHTCSTSLPIPVCVIPLPPNICVASCAVS